MDGSSFRACVLLLAVVVVGCSHPHGSSSGDAGSGDPTADAAAGCGVSTCESQHATCGLAGDGCGGTIDCGSCQDGQTCGGGGTPFQCGSGGGPNACTPRTCQDANAECGVVADGCGGVTTSCGTCTGGAVCGANGVANHCGVPVCTTGLCGQQMACTGTTKTTISGRVTAPGHTDTATWGAPDPIYGALVYVPNGAAGSPRYGVLPFASGVSCDSCSSLVSGDPLVSVTTGVDGTFTLQNAPCGTDIPLVVQLGRWRRMITIPAVACCADTGLAATQTHLPRNHLGETGDLYSDIPRMAFSTGSVDILHCVLRKVGIDDSEFTNPTGSGRVVFYKDTGVKIDDTTPAATALYGNANELAKYDMTLFECVGNQVPKADDDMKRVVDYANAGGRVFATHFSYVWLTNALSKTANSSTGPAPFFQTADWLVNQGNFASTTGLVDETAQSDPATQTRRTAFADWLQLVGASTTRGQIEVDVVRHDFNSVSQMPATKSGTPPQQWLYTTDAFSGPLHYTFDTPIAYAPATAPTQQCGRVLFSDFHVTDAHAGGLVFPSECSTGPMTAQEKTLEFMLFDLASCIGPQPSACAPKTCADLGFTCGKTGDGCDDGVVLDCGSCGQGEICGDSSSYGTCVSACKPRTCADAGAQCGVIGDGCGATVDCGACAEGQACGANGVANQCAGVF